MFLKGNPIAAITFLLLAISMFILNMLHAQSTVIEESAKLLASDGVEGDFFGFSVAISGDTMVVGAFDDDDNGFDSSSAYVFERDQGGIDNWGQVTKLLASDGAALDEFGVSVAISGDTVVVGAQVDDDKSLDSGSAYVFERDQGGIDNWGQVTKLLASDGAVDDEFGFSVAISGDTVVVGAFDDDDNGSHSGSAYVFERDQGGIDNWGQVNKLLASDGAEFDHFGFLLAISGDTVVVGAGGDDDNGIDSGSAYVFERDQGGIDNWGQVTKLLDSDGAAGDRFGFSVAISGNTVVVGAVLDDDNGIDFGSAYVFERDQGGIDNWGQVTKLLDSDGAVHDFFGFSVAISGDTVVVGVGGDDDNGIDSGSAYVFERDQGGIGNWGQVTKLLASDGVVDDFFGFSGAISGDTVVVGALQFIFPDTSTGNGAAYAFSLTTDSINGEGPSAPSITTQPANQDVEAGSSASLSVAAIGDDLIYQWYTGKSGDTASPIAGATSSTLITSALTASTNFWVEVTNAGGSTNSDTAVITVAAPSVPLVLEGTGDIAGENIMHPNGNIFDQILLTESDHTRLLHGRNRGHCASRVLRSRYLYHNLRPSHLLTTGCSPALQPVRRVCNRQTERSYRWS